MVSFQFQLFIDLEMENISCFRALETRMNLNKNSRGFSYRIAARLLQRNELTQTDIMRLTFHIAYTELSKSFQKYCCR